MLSCSKREAIMTDQKHDFKLMVDDNGDVLLGLGATKEIIKFDRTTAIELAIYILASLHEDVAKVIAQDQALKKH